MFVEFDNLTDEQKAAVREYRKDPEQILAMFAFWVRPDGSVARSGRAMIAERLPIFTREFDFVAHKKAVAIFLAEENDAA